MPVTVGGGVRTVDDIRALLRAGADKVGINTAAVTNRAFVERKPPRKFGDQCIVIAIDAKRVSQPGELDRWEIFTHGGRNRTGIDAVDYAREVDSLGAGEILLDLNGSRRHAHRFRHCAHHAPLRMPISVPVIASRRRRQSRLTWSMASRDGHATAVLRSINLSLRRIRAAGERHMAGWPLVRLDG